MVFKKKKVLFVCTQNVFRSMSAHYLAKKYIEENNLNLFLIDSCGTKAYSWETPYKFTLELLEKKGISVINHRNKKINQKLIDENDYIICMTNEHKKFIVENFKVIPYLFNELAFGELTDLNDDDEIDFDCTLNEFLEKTVIYIEKNIPKVIKSLERV